VTSRRVTRTERYEFPGTGRLRSVVFALPFDFMIFNQSGLADRRGAAFRGWGISLQGWETASGDRERHVTPCNANGRRFAFVLRTFCFARVVTPQGLRTVTPRHCAPVGVLRLVASPPISGGLRSPRDAGHHQARFRDKNTRLNRMQVEPFPGGSLPVRDSSGTPAGTEMSALVARRSCDCRGRGGG
jgi:hypothetical protein